MFLSVGPLLLAATGLFHAAGPSTNAFAHRLIEHQHLTGESARLVRETFGAVSNNALAASVAAVVGFLLWGIGVGQIYQDVYARAWRVEVRTLSDQVRFTVWFFVLSGLVGLFVVFAESLWMQGWVVALPAWLLPTILFWVWTPRYLLHGKIAWRALLPGALLTALLIGATTATSRYFLARSVNSDGKWFGSFGVVLALISWGFTLVTVTLACGVFSAVWADWRKGEREQAARAAAP
jgi:membrane protein